MTHELGGPSSLVRFVRHASAMRGLGFVTAACAVAASLGEQQQPAVLILLLWINVLGWPMLAWRMVELSPQPLRAEYRNLLIDTAMAGFWAALTGFDLLPSAMLLSLMMMDRLIAGGWSLALRALVVMLGGALLGWVVAGFPFHPRTSFRTMLWCMPFFCLYPLAIGAVAWHLAERVRKRKRELEMDSRIDPQTGLATRKQWQALVAAEVRRYHRYGTVASLLMVDIDHFKQINDASGHLLGDQVIRDVAACMLSSLRGADSAGRFGGDEFGVLLPGTAREAALDVARRLARDVEARVRVEGRPVSLSVGVAQLGPGVIGRRKVEAEVGVEAWLAAADEALYRAKAAGRNCVSD